MIYNYSDLIVSFNRLTKFIKYQLKDNNGNVVRFGHICYKGDETVWESFDSAIYIDYYRNDIYSSLFFIEKGLIKNINVFYFDNNLNNGPTFVYFVNRVEMENNYYLLIEYK